MRSRILSAVIATTAELLIPNAAYSQDNDDSYTLLRRCSLDIDGVAYMDGPCGFMGETDGSFQIATFDESGALRYFAVVQIERPNEGIGWWNGQPGANHAHNPLGSLHRDGACWGNNTAKVCAWE